MLINTQGKSWYIVKKGSVVKFDVFDENGDVTETKHVLTKEDICVYMESENVEVEELI